MLVFLVDAQTVYAIGLGGRFFSSVVLGYSVRGCL